MKSFNYLSWLTLALALLAWAGVVYFGFWLQESAAEKGLMALNAGEKAESAAHLSRVKSLAKDTESQREELEGALETNIVTIADMIERAGADLGVRAKVGTVLPLGQKDMPGGDSLKTVSFIVQAEGNFSSIVRLVKVYEKFPSFSLVEQFEFERTGDPGSASPWLATIRLRMLTTSDISS